MVPVRIRSRTVTPLVADDHSEPASDDVIDPNKFAKDLVGESRLCKKAFLKKATVIAIVSFFKKVTVKLPSFVRCCLPS